MKRFVLFFLLLGGLVLIDATLLARARGGGGRGGGRPTPTRGTPSAASPSMSRAAPKARPAAARPGNSRTQSQQFLQSSRERGVASSPRQQEIRSTISQQRATNRQSALRTQESIGRNNPNFRNWFTGDFFDRHNFRPIFDRGGHNWWAWTGWDGIADWLGWGWSYPYYYYDGYDYEDAWIAQDQSMMTESDYYVNPEAVQGDYLSLGVFAVGSDASKAAHSNMYLQLALKKDGAIDGTYYNSLTDKVVPVMGILDPKSQKAVWSLADDPNAPVMMTGIYNLTQEVAPILVHFPDRSEQSWVLVRLS